MSAFFETIKERLEGILVFGWADVVCGLGDKYDLQVKSSAAPKDVIIKVTWYGEDAGEFGHRLSQFKEELPDALYRVRLAPDAGITYNNYGSAGAFGGNASAAENTFGAVSTLLRRDLASALKPETLALLQGLANAYVEAGFPNYKTWSFSPRNAAEENAFAELRAHKLIKVIASGAIHVLTEAAQEWALANARTEGG